MEISKEKLMEVLDRNFEEAKVKVTVGRYNKILTDLGFELEGVASQQPTLIAAFFMDADDFRSDVQAAAAFKMAEFSSAIEDKLFPILASHGIEPDDLEAVKQRCRMQATLGLGYTKETYFVDDSIVLEVEIDGDELKMTEPE